MAFCIQYKEEIGQLDTICPHCGYDFPPESPAEIKHEGIVYSPIADIALIVGEAISMLFTFISACAVPLNIITGHILYAAAIMLGCLLSFANVVVFHRIRDLS